MSQVVLEISGKEASAIQALRRVIAEQEKVTTSVRKMKSETKQMESVSQNAFGKRAVSDLKNFATGFLSIASAIGVATAALRDMKNERQQAAGIVKNSEFDLAKLSQLSNSPEQFNKFVDLALKLRNSGAADTIGEGARTVFSLQSAGILDQVGTFARLKANAVIQDVGESATGVGTMMTAFGKKETGDARAIITKAFVASDVAPASVEELLTATSEPAGAARSLGFSDEETLASVALIAKARGSAPKGATRTASLMRALIRNKLGKGSLAKSLKHIEGMNLSEQQLLKLLSDQEAFDAYQVLTGNYDEFTGLTQRIDQSQDKDLVKLKADITQSNPMIRAAKTARLAKAQNEISKLPKGTMEVALDAAQDRSEYEARQQGYNEFSIWMQQRAIDLARLVRDPADILESKPVQGLLQRTQADGMEQLMQESLKQTQEMKKQTRLMQDRIPNPNAHIEP